MQGEESSEKPLNNVSDQYPGIINCSAFPFAVGAIFIVKHSAKQMRRHGFKNNQRWTANCSEMNVRERERLREREREREKVGERGRRVGEGSKGK